MPDATPAPPTRFDLDAYLARIRYSGPREPTLATLNAISWHHATTIPFENLDVLWGRTISLNPEALMAKLVHAQRGGYCFEQNNLLRLALEALGFRLTLLGGRVRGSLPRDVVPPRTHVFLRVHLPAGDYLADVGMGSASLTNALPLIFDRPLPTPHETRRLVRDGDRLFHQIDQGDGWMDLCEFTFEPFHPIDCEVGNWWTSTHPASHFRENLIAGRARPDGTRDTVRDGVFMRRRGAEILEKTPLTSAEQLRGLLAEHFGLSLPDGTSFGPLDATLA